MRGAVDGAMPRWVVPASVAVAVILLGWAFLSSGLQDNSARRGSPTADGPAPGVAASIIETSKDSVYGDGEVSAEAVDPVKAEAAGVEAALNKADKLMSGERPAARDALSVLEKYAVDGNLKAMIRSGEIYESAEAPVKSMIRAYAWYTVAEAFGAQEMSQRRVAMASQMSEGDLLRGQRAAKGLLQSIKKRHESRS